ncbi:hypothetical protein DAI22_06g129200 [Oryza sativa Japonica Group]|nr:hypothetical protein DAI22_06g129200 [Oryza sativa Japonica Group]
MEEGSSSAAEELARGWVILDRVACVDDEEDPREVALNVAEPPRLSTLTVPAKFHALPSNPDELPYVAAADPFGLLVHTAASPSCGLNLDDDPPGSFAVLREFLPVGASNPHEATGIAERVPERVGGSVPHISNLKNVGFLTSPGTGGKDYAIAELQIEAGAELAKLIVFRSGTPAWAVSRLIRPDMPGRSNLHWGWHNDDVISFDGNLWFVNLWRGLISCNPFSDHPVLQFHQLPEHIPIEDQNKSQRDIEADRCVRVSKERLRYVEITRVHNAPVESTTVVVWVLICGPRSMSYWKTNCMAFLGDIWENETYKATGLPNQVPILAGIHPSNPDLVYFFLEHHLFGVNLYKKMVIHFVDEHYQLLQPIVRSRSLQPLSWHQVQLWKLPPSLHAGSIELSAQHASDLGNLHLKAAQLRRQEHALKRREKMIEMREESVQGLHKSLLAPEEKKDDSRWDKVQIVILAVLISGLSLLFPFLPWLPYEYLSTIVIAFSIVVGCCCIALPCALFGSNKWQTCCGESVARVGFMLFSLFVLYCLYRMALDPTLEMTGHSAPPAPADPGFAWKLMRTYEALAVVVTSGQSCCCGKT